MEKIKSKYILNIILSYIPYDLSIILNIIKYNKYLQNKFDISLYKYQKNFLCKNFLINYDDINIDKFTELLRSEFNNFNSQNDKNNIKKIIEEIKEEKTFITKKNIEIKTKEQMKIKLGEKIPPYMHINIIKLELINNENNYDLNEQAIIPFGLFPNLKILHTNNNCILPCSMIMNLKELYINYIYGKELLFLNDTDKNNISLNNLLYLKIIGNRGKKMEK